MTSSVGHIEIRDLTLRFAQQGQSVQALQGITLDVHSGEFVSVIGPSGCGKSTLLNLVAGFIAPSGGSITLDGKPISGPGADRGVVFQQYSLFPWKSVLDNVEFGLKLQGADKRTRQQRAHHLLALAGLGGFENFYPSQLSGGMKQRVGIVRALAANPRILLMDEPFGALDTQTRALMQQMLTELWQTLGISVLFITHDIDEAIFLSDRIYVMTARPGTIKAALPVTLKRPRLPDVVLSPAFLEIRARLHGLIAGERQHAFSTELVVA
ncbi:NitT/TauT family transport system ATP-binding protein [Herbaspirillum sp. Sphag1AN]|uniref:ABC transporter ATP-binding protein n=1 Tax=unclassified Herbaspirillum TaxID=2624150 RepID=UPI0016179A2A|nr:MULTISPECIES: ABC transporter ATP-binding protein [unclassified Herbaspirillum]MBB3211857.1 NitT/TauT family transport system ATP-binding protein [Herbaspirillum sp. Sphag1AN]MBB3244309.1 NitT/TauT family transport system ATP-binding protein [Herbaspirillum sp. Sphag64]